MRNETVLAFDDFIVGTGTVYSSAGFVERLGRSDICAIHAVVDNVASAGVTLTVALQQSSDGRHFEAKNGTPEINAASLTANGTTSTHGSDSGATPSDGFVQFALTLGGTPPTPSAHVRLYVSCRDKS